MIMVYHEIRVVKKVKKNYLVFNKRENGKWIKKSKFIGNEEINKEKIIHLKKQFEKEIILNKKYEYLKKDQIEEIESLKQIYNQAHPRA